ncbi:hypothetical protein ACOME3_000273 [Neoechinorhynchus agilis]
MMDCDDERELFSASRPTKYRRGSRRSGGRRHRGSSISTRAYKQHPFQRPPGNVTRGRRRGLGNSSGPRLLSLSTRPTSLTPCRFYLEGRCNRKDQCPFNHNIRVEKKKELCKFYLAGFCSNGAACVYMHGDFPCKFYHSSGSDGSACKFGDSCRFSHAPITDELVLVAFKRHCTGGSDSVEPPTNDPRLNRFSPSLLHNSEFTTEPRDARKRFSSDDVRYNRFNTMREIKVSKGEKDPLPFKVQSWEASNDSKNSKGVTKSPCLWETFERSRSPIIKSNEDISNDKVSCPLQHEIQNVDTCAAEIVRKRSWMIPRDDSIDDRRSKHNLVARVVEASAFFENIDTKCGNNEGEEEVGNERTDLWNPAHVTDTRKTASECLIKQNDPVETKMRPGRSLAAKQTMPPEFAASLSNFLDKWKPQQVPLIIGKRLFDTVNGVRRPDGWFKSYLCKVKINPGIVNPYEKIATNPQSRDPRLRPKNGDRRNVIFSHVFKE